MRPQDRTGAPEPERKEDGQAPQRFGWRNVGVFLGLLLVNYLVVSLLFGAAANPRVEIPYRPTFVTQLRDGNVATITAKGLGIEGTFGKAAGIPMRRRATTNFSTEVPEFADQAELDQLVQEHGVEVTAEPAVRETRCGRAFSCTSGRRCSSSAPLVLVLRRAGAAGGMFDRSCEGEAVRADGRARDLRRRRRHRGGRAGAR